MSRPLNVTGRQPPFIASTLSKTGRELAARVDNVTDGRFAGYELVVQTRDTLQGRRNFSRLSHSCCGSRADPRRTRNVG